MTDIASDPYLPEPVIACSLSGGEQALHARLLERLRERSLGAVAGLDGVTVAFAVSDEAEADLRALAAAEARCCPFLALEVTRHEHRLRLTVSGPPEARPIIEAMFQVPR